MLDIVVNDGKNYSVGQQNGQWTLDEAEVSWDAVTHKNGLTSIVLNNKSYTVIVEKIDRKAKEIVIRVNGQLYTSVIKEPIDLVLANMGIDFKATKKAEPVKAPMPGMVLKVLVVPGQQIVKGEGIIILEAMKMENVLKADAAGTVKSIKVSEKTAVEKGTVLIEME